MADITIEASMMRIAALVMMAKTNAQNTGCDPVVALMDMMIAAAVLSQEMKPIGTVEDALNAAVPHAAACAADMFPPDDNRPN